MTKLAIDSGQTGIKVRYGNRAALTYPGIRTNAPLFPQLAQVIANVVELDGSIDEVAIGTSGLTGIESDPVALLSLLQELPISRVILAHDSVTSFLGAMGYLNGVVTAAGTGVVTLGVGSLGVSRVDGWGNIIGDAGSGYWIGRLALDRVMRAHDGRGRATAMTDVVRRHFSSVENAYIELQTDPDRVRRIAGFVPEVVELASKDEVSAEICRQAGAELAASALAATDNVGLNQGCPHISLIGGVFRAEPIWQSCVQHLRGRWPDFEPYPAHGDGLDGTEALFDLPSDHPFAQLVTVASI